MNEEDRRLQIRTILGALCLALVSWMPEAHAQASCDAGSLGLATGAEDNTAALTRVLTQCAGKEIRIPAGTFVFRPSGYAQGLTVPAGTTLLGAGSGGAAPTVFRVADAGTFASLLWVRNASHIAIRDIRFEGSHYDSGCARGLDYGHAISLYSDQKAAARVEDVGITGNLFHDFNGNSWVTLAAADGSPGIGGGALIVIDKNSFQSDSALKGGCADRGAGFSVAMISLHGSDDSSVGLIRSVSISNNALDAGYVKQGIVIWSGTSGVSVQYNTIRDAGLHLPATSGELLRYAISIYNSGHEKAGLHPSNIQIVGNTIVNPVSCGIYVAAAQKIEISHNRISGQSDANDVTLPKGAIALNHADEAAVSDNDLKDNHIGITAVVGTVRMERNTIEPRPGGIRTKIYRSDNTRAEIQ
jgi:hypothetical protein